MKKPGFFLWLSLYSFFAGSAFGQDAPTMGSPLSKIIPPSPQAFSIGKYGSNPIGLHTGTVKYSVPFFTFDAGGGYKIPISVSYSSNGVKVDEVAGRVGLQWRMDFTGVINRTIMGAPDETCLGQYRPPTHDTGQYLFYNYLKVASESPCGPFQPDQFSYSFPGYSGKFILNGDSVIQIPFNNLIIKRNTNGYNIITPDGTRYIFGEGVTETNTDIAFEGNSGSCTGENLNAPGITSWHLRKIILASGFEIEYEYDGNVLQPIRYLSGVSQTNKFMQFGTESIDLGEQKLDYFVSTCVQQLEYNLVLLTGIKTRNGSVRFFYSWRADIIGEKKLDSIHLIDRANRVIQRWKLDYSYSFNNSCELDTHLSSSYQALQEQYPELRKRLILKGVTDLSQSDLPLFRFDYNDIDSLPPRLSYSQDYWGYYNGQKNQFFFPAFTYGSLYNPSGIEQGADRDGRFAFTQIGMLKRVYYPTGGYSEYSYEPSQVGYRNYRPNFDTLIITGAVSSSNPIFESDVMVNGYMAGPKIKIEPFSPRYPQTPPGAPEQVLPDTLFQVSLSDPLASEPPIIQNTTSVWDVTEINRTKLVIPGTHNLRLSVRSSYDSLVNFRITIYNPKNEPNPFIPTGYGLKVKEVADFDNFGNKLNYRKFSYHFFKAPEIKDWQYNLRSPADEWLFCSAVNGTNWLEVSLHSSSSHSLFTNEMASYSYPSVTEHFIDRNGDSTGGIQYRFYTALKTAPLNFGKNAYDLPFGGLNGNPAQDLDSTSFSSLPVPGAALTNSDLNDGLELERINFIFRDGPDRVIKNISRNYYSVDPRKKYCDTLYNIRKVGQPGPGTTRKYFNIFSCSRYTVNANWMHLDSSITVSLEGMNDSLRTVKKYDYANSFHMQPTRIIDISSKNEELSTAYKYPSDFPSDPIYNGMVSNHIITPVVEQIAMNVSTGYELSRARMNFKGWHDNKFYLPETIEKSVFANSLQQEAIIQLYDTLGNILQFTGADGLITSIIWGYGGMYPVAKIVGKPYNEAIGGSGISLALLNSINTTEQQMLAELAKLRSLSGSLATTFTYRPLIGISTETDMNGRTAFYEYDRSGRLMHVKDHMGNIIKKYCYNYSGQQIDCNESQ